MKKIELLGVPGSPYTRKMLALLRYRRIPYEVIWGSHLHAPAGYPEPRVKLLPTFYFGAGAQREAVVDSTPLIRRLEAEHSGRSVRPEDEVLGFLDCLIEDFADEWVTKAMFHYRWHFDANARHAAPLLAFWDKVGLDREAARTSSEAFARRQIDRLHVVGSNDTTAPVIEASYRRLVDILDRTIERQGFVLGTRPAAADFALFGQLTQLGQVDLSSRQLLEQASPRLRAWIDRMEDLSGHVPAGWMDRESVKAHLGELLAEIGRVYAPFLVANARAAVAGQAEFDTTIDGQRWTQPVFPYQAKCLQALHEAHKAMTPEGRKTLDEVLEGTGCEALFSE